MAPNIVEGRNTEDYVPEELIHKDLKTDNNYKPQIAWPQFIVHVVLHLCALYGLTICFKASLMTHLWGLLVGYSSGLAVSIGAHRGFSHRSFKATVPAQILALTLHTVAGQNSMYTWVRDHRVHHKYSDTDADPHNINRGFFFSHIGWLITKKHPFVIEKGRSIDLSDLRSNKLVMFEHRYFIPLYFVLGFLIPVLVPVYGWNESWWNSFFLAYCLRYVLSLNLTWCVNSVAHTFGMKPYDKRIHGAQSRFVWVTTFGEGWHNFHHCFPWDYRSSELGWFAVATSIIDLFAQFGLIYDLRTVSQKIVDGHRERHGDKMKKEENDRANDRETKHQSLKSLLQSLQSM